MTLDEILEKIISILDQEIPSLGFVSPTQFLPQVMAIIEGLHQRNYHPVIVWNSNGYELPEMIKLLDKHIDIFLPDFKYSENILAQKYSDAPDYPTIAMEALKTMLFLRGPRLLCDDEGSAYRGILIRHLVLPDHTENSLRILKLIAEELSPTVSLSLMSQYYPTHHASDFPEIDKSLKPEEYSKIVQEATRIGFTNLWLQEMDSEQNYRPDFNKIRPFE
jgi:putative pyruvate formate lyase activating enzyme